MSSIIYNINGPKKFLAKQLTNVLTELQEVGNKIVFNVINKIYNASS